MGPVQEVGVPDVRALPPPPNLPDFRIASSFCSTSLPHSPAPPPPPLFSRCPRPCFFVLLTSMFCSSSTLSSVSRAESVPRIQRLCEVVQGRSSLNFLCLEKKKMIRTIHCVYNSSPRLLATVFTTLRLEAVRGRSSQHCLCLEKKLYVQSTVFTTLRLFRLLSFSRGQKPPRLTSLHGPAPVAQRCKLKIIIGTTPFEDGGRPWRMSGRAFPLCCRYKNNICGLVKG